MTLMVGKEWRHMFDLVIVNAKKPSFFTQQLRHLREYHPETEILSWNAISKVEKGKIYSRVR